MEDYAQGNNVFISKDANNIFQTKKSLSTGLSSKTCYDEKLINMIFPKKKLWLGYNSERY